MDRLGMQGRKWEIFEKSIYAFAKDGYENVSMRDIAELLNMKAASLYNYFPSKENLLDSMYEFYETNLCSELADMDELLKDVHHSRPRDILYRALNYYEEDLQPLMDCIYVIAVAQSTRNEKAYRLIRDNTFGHPQRILRILLNKMMDIGKIEPLDVEAFTLQCSCFIFSAIVFNRTPDKFDVDTYVRGFELLFSLVKEIDHGDEKKKACPSQ